MLARNIRFVIVALLGLSLGACSTLMPKRTLGAPNAGAEGSAAGEPAAEAAKPKLVVVFNGPRSAAMRKRVERMLAQDYEIVPSMRYRKTARRLRATRVKQRNVARVASKIGADAVLHGVLRRKGKRRVRLALRLRDGATGKTLERFALIVPARKLRAKDRAQLASKFGITLDDTGPAKVDPGPAEVVARNDAPKADEKPAAKPSKASPPARDQRDRTPAPPAPVQHYDDRGQAIDDEVPAILR